MGVVSLLRYINGYIEFCAEGGFPERFLNLCKIHGISLWKIKNDGVKVEACTTIGEFKKIEVPAENSGMEVKVLKNKGLPFFAKRHKWRCGAVLGVLITVLFIWFMSGFIWEVEIVEENGVKIENFTESLEELGVKPGARKSKIDILEVQEKLLKKYPQLSWVSLNIFGDKAQIEYTPAKKAPTVIDENTPTNVVAVKSGKITLVEGYSGTNAVKEGAFVAKGSLLISGVTVNADGSEDFVHARGKVFAQTITPVKKQIDNTFDGFITTETSQRYTLDLFNLKIPFGFSPEGEVISNSKINLEGNSTVLPVGIIRADGLLLSEKKVNFTENEALLICLKHCVQNKREDFTDVEFEKINFTQKSDGKSFTVSMNITCVENIATEKPLSVEEN